MVTVSQVRNTLADYVVGTISFEQFEDWLIDHSWNMHQDSPDDARELVLDINEFIYQYLDDYIDEDGLKNHLQLFVKQYEAQASFAGARSLQEFLVSSSSPSQSVEAVFGHR